MSLLLLLRTAAGPPPAPPSGGGVVRRRRDEEFVPSLVVTTPGRDYEDLPPEPTGVVVFPRSVPSSAAVGTPHIEVGPVVGRPAVRSRFAVHARSPHSGAGVGRPWASRVRVASHSHDEIDLAILGLFEDW